MARAILVLFLVVLTVPSLAIKGYLVEKTIVTEHAMMGGSMKQVQEEKEYILPNASITETKLIQGMQGKRARSTIISIMGKEGLVMYDIDHDKKQYFRMVIPYDVLGNLASAATPNLFANLIVCEEGKKCRINKKAFRFTGKKKKIGKWIAKEVVSVSKNRQGADKKGSTWVAKDKALEEASILYLKNFVNSLKKSSAVANNPYLLKLYTDGFKALKDFIKKHGAPVMTVEEKMGMRIIETVKNVKKIDIPESMLRPPKGYKEFKMPQGMPMMPMLPPPGGTR